MGQVENPKTTGEMAYMHLDKDSVPPEDRAIFLRENAVSIVDAREARIERLRHQIRILLASAKGRKKEIAKLQAENVELKRKLAEFSVDLKSRDE